MRPKKNQGQILVFVSLALMVLVAMLGMVVDGGWAYYRQQNAQSAADAAALAGAQAALYRSGGNITPGGSCPSGIGVVCQTATACSNPVTNPPANDIDSACLYAQVNGFAVGSSSKQNVMIEAGTTNPLLLPSPVAGVNYTYSDNYYVRARVAETFPLTFTAVLGRLTQLTSARATAVISQRTQTCAYVLNPSGANSLTVNGANVTGTCGFYVDSSASPAMTVNGSTVHAGVVDVVGGDVINGSTMTGTVTTGVSPVGNPLAYVQPPSVGACGSYTPPTSVGAIINLSPFQSTGGSSVTLNPGVYCGGISVTGTTSVIFNSGTYILNGGGMTINGVTTVANTGSGVTFYDTYSSGHAYGGITINGSPTVTLSAPTTGSLQGMLFFQDPTVPVGSAGSVVNGSSSSVFSGVFDFPTTSLTYNGNGSSAGYTSIVAYNLTINGVGSFNASFPAANGSPFKAVALVE